MSVMKIAMIFDGLGWGGTERVGIDYVRIMKELGCDVDVYNLIPSLNAMESNIPTDVNIIHYHFSRFLSPQAYSRILYKASFCGIFLYIAMYIACSIINFTAVQDSSNFKMPSCNSKALLIVIGHI